MSYKVAIFQSAIIPGGRLRVLLGIIDVLNEMGIEPDAFTSKITFRPDEIKGSYGKIPKVNFHLMPNIPMPYEFSVIFFNVMMNYFASGYDLIINTNNNLSFLPRRKKVISYVFYPRESRVKENVLSIHEPERFVRRYSFEYFSRIMLRLIYNANKVNVHHRVISMTEFTKLAIKDVYPTLAEMPVVYPPVEIDLFKQEKKNKRTKQIVTIGRLAPDKRQLEQIRLASRLPEFSFHIIGFAGDEKYYQECRLLIEELKLTNVSMYPNASFDEMKQVLHQSKYFLHTLFNEPFGITAVQAIAAGCMPIVHDSGGQREVVTHPQLRFKGFDEIPRLIENLENLDDVSFERIQSDLLNHVVNKFNDTVFHEKIKSILGSYLIGADDSDV